MFIKEEEVRGKISKLRDAIVVFADLIKVELGKNEQRSKFLVDAVKQMRQGNDVSSKALKMVLPSDDPNISYIEKHFSVCRNENVIDDVRNRVAAYEDSVCRYREMVETAKYTDSIANKLLLESKEIRRIMEKPK